MAPSQVIPADKEAKDFGLSAEELNDLVLQAKQGDEDDRKLTIKQAIRQYRGPVLWAMFLSTSLIMEGFDLVTVRWSRLN
jgi:SP family general alpha glucoside:H+ symporter-like MFS transporter